MSWIEEEEKLLRIQNNYRRESVDSIKCFFLFMNKNHYIEQITDEMVCVQDGKISKERVLKLIQEKRYQKQNVKYVFSDAWMFLVDLEPDQIQIYSQMDVSIRFLTPLPLLEDINIAPSIFIFHDLNAVYFLFEEVESEVRVAPKSALKNAGIKKKATKKVSYSKHFNTTRKNISI
jgi:hypothetical protein